MLQYLHIFTCLFTQSGQIRPNTLHLKNVNIKERNGHERCLTLASWIRGPVSGI